MIPLFHAYTAAGIRIQQNGCGFFMEGTALYLHLGQDYIVPLQNVVSVFDMDTATASKRTQALLSRLEREGRIIELYDDLPRAAVLCESGLGETLYLTELSPQALQRRAKKGYAV